MTDTEDNNTKRFDRVETQLTELALKKESDAKYRDWLVNLYNDFKKEKEDLKQECK